MSRTVSKAWEWCDDRLVAMSGNGPVRPRGCCLKIVPFFPSALLALWVFGLLLDYSCFCELRPRCAEDCGTAVGSSPPPGRRRAPPNGRAQGECCGAGGNGRVVSFAPLEHERVITYCGSSRSAKSQLKGSQRVEGTCVLRGAVACASGALPDAELALAAAAPAQASPLPPSCCSAF